jgi:hypothetical protein
VTRRKQKILTRSKHITLRITQAEKDQVSQKAAGRSLSCYIRSILFKHISRPALRPCEQRVIRSLGELSEFIDHQAEIVRTHKYLNRGGVIEILQKVDGKIDEAKLGILEAEYNSGDR